MDRVLVRSFRAHDLAERGFKDLARSRIDTTRELVFQPLGARFFEAREDAAGSISSGRTRFTRRPVTSRGWSCAWSRSSPSGFRSLSPGPSSRGLKPLTDEFRDPGHGFNVLL